MIGENLAPEPSLTVSQLIETVHEWDLPFRLNQKFEVWHLKYAQPQLTDDWWKLIHHSLTFFIMKRLPWMLKDLTEQSVELENKKMKEVYQKICIRSPLNDNKFNFHIIIVVKLIFYFLASHVDQLKIDRELENSVYSFLILNWLGLEVKTKAYNILVKNCTKKSYLNKQRNSMKFDSKLLDKTSKNISLPTLKKKTTMFTSYKRRRAKEMAEKLEQEGQRNYLMEEMTNNLKDNLYVKPYTKPTKAKFPLAQLELRSSPLKDSGEKENDHSKSRVKPKKSEQRMVIQSTQLSNSLTLNQDIRLSQIKSFSIHCTNVVKQSYSKSFCNSKNNTKTLKLDKVQPKQSVGSKSMHSSKRDWRRMVTEMKEQLYKNPKKKQRQMTEVCNEERSGSLPKLSKKPSKQIFEYYWKKRHSRESGSFVLDHDQLRNSEFKPLDLCSNPHLLSKKTTKISIKESLQIRQSGILKLRL